MIKYTKRFLILMLCVCLLGNLFLMPETAMADAITEEQPVFTEVNFCFGETEVPSIEVMIKDGCLLVDYRWLFEQMDLKLESFETYCAGFPNENNYYLKQMYQGYEEAFGENVTAFGFSKKNSGLAWFFCLNSSKAFCYSPYIGSTVTDMGTDVIAEKNSKGEMITWIPLVMFLNLCDSYCSVLDGEIYVQPCMTTVKDILHRTDLDSYYMDAMDTDVTTNVARGYNNFYHKVKSLFKGVVGVSWTEFSKTFHYDNVDVADLLALQLCSPNEQDISAESQVVETYGTIAKLIEKGTGSLIVKGEQIRLEGYLLKNGIIDEDVYKELFAPTVKEVEEFSKLAKEQFQYHYDWTQNFQTLDDLKGTLEEASELAKKAKTAKYWAKGIDIGLDVSLAGYVQYIISANEISKANQKYVDCVKTYLTYAEKANNVQMSSDIRSIINDKTKLYDGKNTNPFENEQLTTEVGRSVGEALISNLAELGIEKLGKDGIGALGEKTIEQLGKKTVNQFVKTIAGTILTTWNNMKYIAIAWDFTEMLVNKVTGGAFDKLDALQGIEYALFLEHDAENILKTYKKGLQNSQTIDWDAYRQLEWMRLRSYCLERENLIASFAMQKNTHKEIYEEVYNRYIGEIEELSELMAILLMGQVGTSKESLDTYSQNCIEANRILLDTDIFYNRISGKIVNRNGDGLVGAVYVCDEDGNRHPSFLVLNGEFEFSEPCGKYTIYYESNGYGTIQEEVELKMGENIDMGTITLLDSTYILPESNSRIYDIAELQPLSAEELELARNEIYARYGRKFQREDLKVYFNGKSWYQESIEPEDFDENTMFSDVEKANLDLIRGVEEGTIYDIIESQTPKFENSELTFDVLPSEFVFTSGVGAWETVITLNDDGTFKGQYQDSDMGYSGPGYSNGTVFICDFNGKFTTPKKINEYTYSMNLESLDVETSDTVYYENDIRYIVSAPYGFDDADEFLIYLPGCPLEETSEGFLSWSFINTQIRNTIPTGVYGIYNVGGKEGFMGEDDNSLWRKTYTHSYNSYRSELNPSYSSKSHLTFWPESGAATLILGFDWSNDSQTEFIASDYRGTGEYNLSLNFSNDFNSVNVILKSISGFNLEPWGGSADGTLEVEYQIK